MPTMNKAKHQILKVLGILIALADSALLSFILLWLIAGHGIIACGKGVFDNPDWLMDILILVGAPAGILVCSIALIRYCSGRLSLQ